ncbi:MAG: hypothetical protein ACTSQY_11385 [Candidatus Odinarchaeia archaeon]
MKCKECNTELGESTGSFPNDPCPITCETCGYLKCPDCGGDLNREEENEELRRYCHPGCECGWGCCGGCV